MDGWMLRGLIKRKTGTHATFPFLHFTTPRKEFPSDIGVLRSHPLPSAWFWSSTCTHGPSFCGLSFVLWHTSPCSSCFVKHLNDALITKSTKAWRFEIWNECNVITDWKHARCRSSGYRCRYVVVSWTSQKKNATRRFWYGQIVINAYMCKVEKRISPTNVWVVKTTTKEQLRGDTVLH